MQIHPHPIQALLTPALFSSRPTGTPLFALASTVVTDIGGPLSHGSIVAREYGLPAALGTGSGASERKVRLRGLARQPAPESSHLKVH